jgi:hypothetical protein
MADQQHQLGMPLGKLLEEEVVQEFATNLRGELIRSEDDGYDTARAVFNGMVNKRPAMIVRCAGTSDVIHGVNFARTHNLLLSVRGGGHSIAGKAVCDGGVMLDLSRMKGIKVDPVRRTTEAQPGLTLGEFDHETQAFGLATTLGIVSLTGIAGLTLGGGLGWLNGKHGLACDNLISADVVTADGQLLTANAEENKDLYWGIRGGSGNFGIVTSFKYQLYPVDVVLGGGLLFPEAKAREALRFCHEFASTCPDELSTSISLGRTSEGGVVAGISLCYCGSLEMGEQLLRPLRTFGPPLEDNIRPMSYRTLQSALDVRFPFGQQHYWKTSVLKNLSDEAIEVMVRFMAQTPSPASGIALQQMHGAASRVDPAATAFPHRDEHYDFMILSQWSDPADSARNIEWTRGFFEAMQPHLERGAYVNPMGEEREDAVKEAYGSNYERLAVLKSKYDPTNFFHLNHNIKPTARSSAM